MQNRITKFSLGITILAFTVILLGAYTRLKDAGLGCPDWPGCYGQFLAPPDEKAWIEMIHRYVAGTLGLLIFALTIWRFNVTSVILSGLVIFQALLGMWTVTLGLYPVVVMGHLLGGFAILSLLWLFYLQLSIKKSITGFKILTWICFIAISIQIALGGWTSANYAALVCSDFPSCQGQLWPEMNVFEAFNLVSVGIFDSPGIPLENTARVTIQMFHRIGALITAVLLLLLSYKLIANKYRIGYTVLLLLTLQIILGVTNVLTALPLPISLMHNAFAALLLLSLITILSRTYAK